MDTNLLIVIAYEVRQEVCGYNIIVWLCEYKERLSVVRDDM